MDKAVGVGKIAMGRGVKLGGNIGGTGVWGSCRRSGSGGDGIPDPIPSISSLPTSSGLTQAKELA